MSGPRHLTPNTRHPRLAPALALVLVAAVANHVWLGASPLVPGLNWPGPEARAPAVDAALETIPPSASVAATSTVYPHVASRGQAYWFPAIQDAEFIAADATRNAPPLLPRDLRDAVSELLFLHEYGVVAAAPGLLVLRRDAPNAEIPAVFFQFARPSDGELATASHLPALNFGPGLQLDGYHLDLVSTITVFGPSAVLTTYWHVDRPIANQLSFVFYLTQRQSGAIVGELRDQAPEPVWYPTSRWQPGQTIRVTVTFERARDVQAVGVAVVDPTTGQRLPLHAAPGSVLWENGTIARVVRIDGGN